MRSNYSPYPQKDLNNFNQIIGAIDALVLQYVKLNDQLIADLQPQIEQLLRHHTANRVMGNFKLTNARRDLKQATGNLLSAFDQCKAEVMAEIEGKRAEFHHNEQVTRQRERREREEYNSLTIDQGSNTYFYLKQVEVTAPDGRVTVEKRKTYLQPDHPWVVNALRIR